MSLSRRPSRNSSSLSVGKVKAAVSGASNLGGTATNASAQKKVLKKIGKDDIKLVRSHTELAQTANGVRMLTRNLAKATIQLHVRAIMITTKARDNLLTYLTREVVEWLMMRPEEITVYVDYHLEKLARFGADKIVEQHPRARYLLKYWTKQMAMAQPEVFDLVVSLGGDGTVLYVSTLFQRVVPPVMAFALGSLGFLTNFRFEQFRRRMAAVLDNGAKAYMRMRFTCRVHDADGRVVTEQQVLNELVVDRGPLPYVTNLELYGDGSLLTVAQADGLIIATPTGSTAYSLSAGGLLVHPGVSAISVTPICPHTLSFRPVLLPDGMTLQVKVPSDSRATAWASFDGKVRTKLERGYFVVVTALPFPFPTVRSHKTEYFDSVSRNLNWNARETQKPFSSYLTLTRQAWEDEKHTEVFDIDYSLLEETTEPSRYDLGLASSGSLTPTFDNRTCYAHPNAIVSLLGETDKDKAGLAFGQDDNDDAGADADDDEQDLKYGMHLLAMESPTASK